MTTLSSQVQQNASDVDFKQFAREFETHRSSNPQESFNRSLSQFLSSSAPAEKTALLNRN